VQPRHPAVLLREVLHLASDFFPYLRRNRLAIDDVCHGATLTTPGRCRKGGLEAVS